MKYAPLKVMKKSVLGLALPFMLAPIALTSSAQAESLRVDCEIPNHIVCQISNPDGFSRVRVSVDFGGEIGRVDVVDERYRCRTNATVSWDPIVPNYEVFTEKCNAPLPLRLQPLQGQRSRG